ncbi:MAG: AAA family ATPase [Chitinophagales bacterium]|jgi:hypothetical protein|nr:AAA family ATPase [Chitinophagales bacterium]
MSYFRRKIDKVLLDWKNSDDRKPLMLRGARQVGKSSAIRHLAKQFEFFVEVNFDLNPDYAAIFQESLHPKDICEKLSVLFNTPIEIGKTLVFFDEVQSCIPAISSLRYFYETMPNLHVIASGSLLEFALADVPSFGVGRVRSVYLYPFSFEEFLMANNENLLLESIKKFKFPEKFSDIFHQKLLSLFKKFLIIGGMPEAVKVYVEKGDMLEVQRTLDDLIISIQADFTKYKKLIEPIRVKEVFESVVKQIGFKYTYSYPNATLNNKQIKDILELLRMGGLIYYITHSSSNGIPIGAETNPKFRKMLLFDTGIFQRLLHLNIGELILENDFTVINKGNLAELHVGLELIKNNSYFTPQDLYYWQREAKNSQAEVDYVIQNQGKIIPIEVKAGTKGAMQSLYKFLEEKNSSFGIRTSLENFAIMEKVHIIPLYAIGLKVYD